MDFKKYQEGTTRTFKPHRELTAHEAEILDWSTGLTGEVGEVAELIKHNIFHNETIDKMKLSKEIGDVLWYVSALCKVYDIPMEACAELNLAKLEHRHGSAFSFDKSANRHAQEEKFTDTIVYQDLQSAIIAGIEE
jgi:NTP pyrophosphatase (non-canonical NTP hydrolase)